VVAFNGSRDDETSCWFVVSKEDRTDVVDITPRLLFSPPVKREENLLLLKRLLDCRLAA
ncbi:MAG: hypothetical protein ACI90V_014101, partial [Bacillariaceae sp.]